MVYKCVNCGGNVVYNPDLKEMYCPYCEGNNCGEEKFIHTEMTLCPNCGGEVTVEEHTAVLKCAYCDHSIILDERVEERYKPTQMIPFKLGKETIKEKLRQRFKNAIFAPTDFLMESRLKDMQGEYVPFWMYDYDADSSLYATGVKVKVWMSGNTEYTEKSFYNIRRRMQIKYENIPVDASIPMPDTVMDLMEPYDYKDLVDFDKKYLSGFLGEKYNLDAGVLEGRAREKMETSTKQQLRSSVTGYSALTNEDMNVAVRDKNSKYDLLPVWKYIYRYKDQDYPFYINGQTGKIVGKVPVSKAKVLAYSATVWGILTALLAMSGFIISNL